MIRSQRKEIVMCLGLFFLAQLSETTDEVNWSQLESCGDFRKCITYNLCPEISSRIGTAEMTSNISVSVRFGDDFSGCRDSLEVCCPEPFKVHPVCNNDSLLHRECGTRNNNGFNENDSKLIAGFAEFPWIVAIFEDAWVLTTSHKFFKSSGSLIHPKVVISSAGDIADISADKLEVRAGEWNLQSVGEICKHEDRGVAKVIKHEEYSDNSFQNNLALIILEKEFQLSPIINVVCLPPKIPDYDEHSCLLSGWDKEVANRIDKAILKKAGAKVVSHLVCEEKLRKTMLGAQFQLHQSFLCAEGEMGIDFSNFSGGSSLMCSTSSHPNHLFLAGVAVGGFSCAFKNIPEMYAGLSKQRDWIEKQLLMNGIGYSFG